MAAFIDVSLVAAIHAAGIVPFLPEHFEIPFRRTAIVARENDHGVFVDAGCFHRRNQVPHVMIHLLHKVGVGIDTTRAFERRYGHDGRMRCRKRKIDKEGFVFLRPFLHALHCLVEKMRQDFVDLEIRRDGSFAIPAVGIFFLSHPFFALRLRGHLAGIHPDIGRHIE